MKKNLTWLAIPLLLCLFAMPAAVLADGPTPNCTTNPQNCQPPIPQAPFPHPPAN